MTSVSLSAAGVAEAPTTIRRPLSARASRLRMRMLVLLGGWARDDCRAGAGILHNAEHRVKRLPLFLSPSDRQHGTRRGGDDPSGDAAQEQLLDPRSPVPPVD